MSHVYAVNKTNTHLSLRTGYTVIPPNSHLKILKTDSEHPDFAHAVGAGWLEFSDKEPTSASEQKGPEFITSAADAMGGMTEKELKEMLAKTPAPEAPETKGTALGRGDQNKSEETTEQTETTETAESTEAAPKRGKKATS